MDGSRRLRAGAAGRSLAFLLVAALLWTGSLAPAAHAAVVASEAALATSASLAGDADRARVADFLARADVRGQLEALGVDPDQARERVATLTDAEAASLAGQLDALPAGGSAALGLAIAALVIVLILALELMGIIDIFPQIGARR
jgi:hypothetical protein